MTVRKRANNTPTTTTAAAASSSSSSSNNNTKTTAADDGNNKNLKNGDVTTCKTSEEIKDNNKTHFPAAMTERAEQKQNSVSSKQPNGGDAGSGNNTEGDNDNNGPLLSIRLDVYHNLRSLKESLNTFSMQDFSKFPLHMWSVLKDRTKHVDKSMTGVSLYAFTIIFALALITRFYAISRPHHVW